jgi:two-component system, chemotaxis family, chemotaxis protein CheY
MFEPASVIEHDCVLVVDDEEGIREALTELIEMIGCTAMVAANGQEALKLMAQRRPCMIILDLLMPVMSGEEMLEVMKQHPTLASVPVLISTSAPGRAPAGMPVVAKPIDIEVVWNWIRRTCRCPVPGLNPASS